MVEAAERDGYLTPDSILVESSSGNLGVALSMIAASKGYRFLCVTDSRCNLSTRLIDGGAGQSGAHRHRAGPRRRPPRCADRLRPQSLCASDERYVWLNQYTNPEQLEGALPHDRAGDRLPVPETGRAVRRGRHYRNPDGLRALLPGVAPAGAGRRRGYRRLGGLRWSAGPPDDSRPGHERPSAAARRVLCGRGRTRRGGGHHPRLPSSGQKRVPVRRLHRHGGQRRDGLDGPARRARISPRSPSPRTSASAISTPCTSPTGCRTFTETVCSLLTSSPRKAGPPYRAPPTVEFSGLLLASIDDEQVAEVNVIRIENVIVRIAVHQDMFCRTVGKTDSMPHFVNGHIGSLAAGKRS